MQYRICLISLLLLTSFFSKAEGIFYFEEDLELVKEKARREHKGIFVLYYAEWCAFCNQFQNEVLQDPDLQKEMDNAFVSYRVLNSSEQGKAFKAAYNIRSLPTLLFFDEEGNIKTLQSGFMTVDEFRKFIRKIYQYYYFKEFPEPGTNLAYIPTKDPQQLPAVVPKFLNSINETNSCTNNTACDDGNPCTINDFCVNGVCTGMPQNCDDGNPCTTDSCDPETGNCIFTPNTIACDDGNDCTVGDACADGICTPGPDPLDCDDGNPCTLDDCTPTGGCSHTPLANGTVCPDDACTTGRTCMDGVCSGGTPTECPDDGNLCTTATCDPLSGCTQVNNNNICDDGDPCTVNDVCTNGVCAGMPKVCDDSNPCTTDSCDPKTGECIFTPNTIACDDGNACTVGDVCADGVCGGTSRNCDDNDRCTIDTCDPMTGCTYTLVANNTILKGEDYPGPPANTIIADSTINTINYIGTFDNPTNVNDPAFQRLSVDSLVNLNLFTGKAILMRHGFEVKQGAVFKAEIQNCGSN